MLQRRKRRNLFPSNYILINRVALLILFTYFGCKQSTIDSPPRVSFSLEKMIDLPIELHESSGLLYFNSLFWSFNDGGNLSEIYGIDTLTGELQITLRLKGYKQNDWEDITMDSSFIYIGDIGNNYGSRRNLSVIKISKNMINNLSDQELTYQSISFTYPDQVDFTDNYRNNSFDCEALVSKGDSLFLFTKDWINYTSSIYIIPKIPGTYVAKKMGIINSEGLIAGADYNEQNNQLVLTGYADFIPMVIINKGNENFERILFEDFSGVKLEGIVLKGDQIFVSSEGSVYQQAIYRVVQK